MQTSIDEAKAKGDQGMARALEYAEAETPEWGEIAYRFLHRYAEEHREFPGFFVTAASEMDQRFPAPSNERSWGMVYRRAMKAGILEKTQREMPHPKRHGCPACVYRSLVYAQI